MSTIIATNARLTNVQDSAGANGSTPLQLQQGRAKAWINFDGTGTIAARDSFNITSLTDNGTGDYTMTFTTPFPSANYSYQLGGPGSYQGLGTWLAASHRDLFFGATYAVNADTSGAAAAFFGD